MSRTKGTYTLTSNIEPKVGAPLDARTVVKLLTDLTANNTFEYPYKGMTVFVEENSKSYTLIGADTTVGSNWSEAGVCYGTVINATLLANGWDANNRQSLQFTEYNINQNGVIGMPTTVTSAQKIAYQGADIRVYSQSGTTFTFEATAVPEIDLPVSLFVTDVSSGGGGGGGTVTDVKVNGISVVDQDGEADIDLSGYVQDSDLGTAAAKDIPATGNAGLTEVVMGNDTRLTDARTPVSHTHTTSDISNFPTMSDYIQKSDTAGFVKNDGSIDTNSYLNSTLKGTASGVAELDANGKVPSSQLPSYVDDVIEGYYKEDNGKFYKESTYVTEITGEAGKIYISLDTDKTYRWSGSVFAEISASLALGETSSSAYRGDRGKTAYDHSQVTSGNPHNVTASDVGLGNVNNTSDLDKPISTATQTALNGKVNTETGKGLSTNDYTTTEKTKLSTLYNNTVYGTCDTAGNVKDKVVTLSDSTNWTLTVGSIVGVKFTYTNTYVFSAGNRVTLNVNNTGAKTIKYSNDVWTSGMDSKCPTAYGEADQTIYYMYDGTYWVWISHSKDTDTTYEFDGNTFISEDGENYFHGGYSNGNANNMTANGHYYYNTNGPSTAIGAYGNDGAMLVQAYDSDNVAQIAQNYENGNIFVRGKANGTWTDWKRPSANIISNNTVLSTDKTPYLNRQCLTPTGFSSYVREKLIGCSVAWNQQIPDGDFTDATKWECANGTFTISGNVATITCTTAGNVAFNPSSNIETIANHKYIACVSIESTSGKEIQLSTAYSGTEPTTTSNKRLAFIGYRSSSLSAKYPRLIGKNMAVGEQYKVKCFILTDLTLAFGSTVADTLYAMTNNGGIDWLRNHNYPIDQYTQYGYYLVSTKPSAKKCIFKNLVNWQDFVIGSISGTGEDNNVSTTRLRSPFIRVAPNTTYAFSTSNSLLVFEVHEYVAEGNWIKYTGINATSGTLTTSVNTNLIKVLIRKSDNATIQVNENNTFQAEKGSQATAYTPYAPITYSLGSTELRGHLIVSNGEIVAEGDVRESNGNVTRNWREYTFTGSESGAAYGQGFYLNTGISASNGLVAEKFIFTDNINNVYTGTLNCSCCVANGSGAIGFYKSDITTLDAMKTYVTGMKIIMLLATPTTETSSPFADPMSLNGCTTEEYVDDRTIPVPVGHETQYMGQSEDVVEIPSGSLSDGKRKFVAETSGGKTQYYWEDYVSENPKQAIIESLLTYTSVTNKYTFPVDGYVHLQMLNTATSGDYVLISVYDSYDNYVTGAKLIATGNGEASTFFVKKGMQAMVTLSTGQVGTRVAFRGIT